MAAKRRKHNARPGRSKPRRTGKRSVLRVVDGGADGFLNREKTGFEKTERDDTGKFLPGTAPGPGRPPGSRSTVTPLRRAFANVFDQVGGEAMLLKVARRYPRDFLALAVKLEPRLLHADVDLGPTEWPVKVVLPWNGRCDRASLDGVGAAHQETEGEAVLRFAEEVEYEQARAMRVDGIDTTQRQRWFAELLRGVRQKLEQARADNGAEVDERSDGDE